MTEVHVLGIRHHGPGSARSVDRVLRAVQPDVVVIEGAPELDALVPTAGSDDLVPPVAGLVYLVDQPRRASFYPMAAFSPEWTALRWAVANGATVRFADLPATNALAPENRLRDDTADLGQEPDGDAPDAATGTDGGDAPDGASGSDGGSGSAGRAAARDPIAALARAAGYDEPERWWDDAVEHRIDPATDDGARAALEVFAAIGEAMAAMRADAPADRGNERREAAMRRIIRAVLKEGHPKVVVVCGAWHAPALDPRGFPSVAADNRTLKGLRKRKVAVTWAPWTAGRLTRASGYGAGVAAPGWYAHQHTADPATLVESWMVRVAHALRAQDLTASSAEVIDAVRLARTLATLRGRPSVGLAECNEAVQAVLCGGSALPLRLVTEQVIVGEALGRVPDDIPVVPLAADLRRRSRSARLQRSATEKVITVDLRTPAGLAKSTLLHRLDVLDIGWGRPADAGSTTGTFKEAWSLQWAPELEVAVIEAGLWGTTVEGAAEARAIDLAQQAAGLLELTRVLSRCMPAVLPLATAEIAAELERRSADLRDVPTLMRSTAPLAEACRYGTVRQLDVSGLEAVLHAIIVRICAGLRPAVMGLDDDAATALRRGIDDVHRAVSLLVAAEAGHGSGASRDGADDGDGDVGPAGGGVGAEGEGGAANLAVPRTQGTAHVLRAQWLDSLAAVALAADRGGQSAAGRGPIGGVVVHGSIAGRVDRLLLDARRTDPAQARDRLARVLSRAADASRGAAYLDGFLDGDAALLLLDDELLDAIDDWVHGAAAERFDDLLPLLRRTFSRYSKPERQAIGRRLTRTRRATPAVTIDPEELDVDAMARALALLGG